MMMLTFTLSNTEYIAVMDSLHEAVIAFGGYRTRSTTRERSVHALELEHLRTLLAEASINSVHRCNACDQTAERCTDWGGGCCPLCTHQKVSA